LPHLPHQTQHLLSCWAFAPERALSTGKPKSFDPAHHARARTVASPEPVAWARTENSTDWALIVAFEDRDGKHHRLQVSPAKYRRGNALYELLEQNGYPLPKAATARERIKEQIVNADPPARILLVSRPGWHKHQFLLGDKCVGRGAERIEPQGENGPHTVRTRRKGKLTNWQAKIAAPSRNSSYLTFALCLGFASPLLKFVQVENGGFHFWGKSSTGKSTLQAVVASIFGRGTVDDAGYIRTWKATVTAVEQIATGHCDHPLILDELKLLDSDPRKAAEKASEITYLIASGSGKARSTHYADGAGNGQQYRTLVLSSGEISLLHQARAAGSEQLPGEQARLIDVPVPDDSTGIFDQLSARSSGENSRSLADTLRDRAARSCGTAGRAYVQALVDEANYDKKKLERRLESWMNQFYKEASVDLGNGYEVRFARRFALACAAGRLAIKYGIVPWDSKEILNACRRIYAKATSTHVRRTVDLITEAAQRVVTKLQTFNDQLVDLTDPAEDSPKTPSKQRPSFACCIRMTARCLPSDQPFFGNG
jgi:putative DNA primase/helicase